MIGSEDTKEPMIIKQFFRIAVSYAPTLVVHYMKSAIPKVILPRTKRKEYFLSHSHGMRASRSGGSHFFVVLAATATARFSFARLERMSQAYSLHDR
jgi:hypothetical protein